MPRYADYHRTVIGYHGTRRETALDLVSLRVPFTPSENDDDWLGHGVYFWEYAPQRAWEWARDRYEPDTEVAVIGSMIRLGNCFDLLDPQNLDLLDVAHREMLRALDEAGQPPPKQNANSRKYTDCATFQYAYEMLGNEGQPADTCRAVFVPAGQTRGDRLWKRSGLFRGAHIQLCVRNLDCILGSWLVAPQE